MPQAYDVIIVGSGPGGYSCAIRCAQLGLTTAIVEKEKLGGTCLNIGCIPTKALLESSRHFEMTQHKLAEHGVEVKSKLNLKVMMTRKDDIVKTLTSGVSYLMKKNKIQVYEGLGQILSPTEIKVQGKSEQILQTRNIIIATGSESRPLKGIEFDNKQIISSTEALSLKTIPKSLTIIGAGVIGLEIGSVWKRLGTKSVHLIEYADSIGGSLDTELSKKLLVLLKEQGLEFTLNTLVTEVKTDTSGCTLSMKNQKTDKISSLKSELVLVAVGRQAFTKNLGLENLGLESQNGQQIPINKNFQVEGFSNIYAIGDATYGPMLAHKAEEEGVCVAEFIAGHPSMLNYALIPGVIYTHPEVAYVGFTEEELKKQQVPYLKGSFPFAASGRAKTLGDETGFVKVLCHKENHKILGVHILGYKSSEYLSEAIVAMKAEFSAEDLAHTCHSHPSLSEALKEACLAALGRVRQC